MLIQESIIGMLCHDLLLVKHIVKQKINVLIISETYIYHLFFFDKIYIIFVRNLVVVVIDKETSNSKMS
jgi:hypothetical protein